jgi:hypothetical protein
MYSWPSANRRFTWKTSFVVFAFAALLSHAPSKATAQQPFYTDDGDVTPRKKFHLQISSEYDGLQRSSYPSLRQNTAVFELDYGAVENVEIGVDGPLILISNSRLKQPDSVFGFGDLDFHLKYTFSKSARDRNVQP